MTELSEEMRAALERVPDGRWQRVEYDAPVLRPLEAAGLIERETHDWYDAIRRTPTGRKALGEGE